MSLKNATSEYTLGQRIIAGFWLSLFFGGCATLLAFTVISTLSDNHVTATTGNITALQVSENEINILNDTEVNVSIEGGFFANWFQWNRSTDQDVNVGGGYIPMKVRIED